MCGLHSSTYTDCSSHAAISDIVKSVCAVTGSDIKVLNGLQGYFYYIFGFCFVVGALTVIITIEVAIVTTYVQLCAEDYQWW